MRMRRGINGQLEEGKARGAAPQLPVTMRCTTIYCIYCIIYTIYTTRSLEVRLWELKKVLKTARAGLWPSKRSEFGSKLNLSVIGMLNGFSTKIWALLVHWGPGSTRQLRLFGLLEPDFHSVNVGGATFEGSLKTFLRDLDEVGV